MPSKAHSLSSKVTPINLSSPHRFFYIMSWLISHVMLRNHLTYVTNHLILCYTLVVAISTSLKKNKIVVTVTSY